MVTSFLLNLTCQKVNYCSFDKSLIPKVISDIYHSSGTKKPTKPFNFYSAFMILEQAIQILKKEPSVLEINKPQEVNVFGDIHGSLESILQIVNKTKGPKNETYLFLGDYVDRGEKSCEVIILLLAYKCLYPKNIYLIRGNHEFIEMNNTYGFKKECIDRVKVITKEKIYGVGEQFYSKIADLYNELPISAILYGAVFCVNGGISNKIKSREELKELKKAGKNLQHFFWNDPHRGSFGFSKYKENPARGIGYLFD